MERLTIAALTALNALCHRVSLTRDELDAVSSRAPGMGPQLWEETVRLLASADAAGPGSRIDLGFSDLILAWLGFDSEAADAETSRSIGAALSRDCGRLAAVAEAVDPRTAPTMPATQTEIELRGLVAAVWSDRARRIASRGRGAEAIEAIARSIHVWHLPPDKARALWANLARKCDESGCPRLADEVRRRMEAVPPSSAPTVPTRVDLGTVLAFSVLWCITHGELLRAERELDSHIPRSADEWERIRGAVAEGRVGDIPIPINVARAWCVGEGLEVPDLRGSLEGDLEALPLALRAVEVLWGGTDYAIPPALLPALRDALAIARVRRAKFEQDYVPPEGERQNIFYEVHQGARRPETMDRYRLIKRLNAIFDRYSDLDGSVLACVHLDHAAENESQGLHEQTRQHLEEARRLLQSQDDIDEAEYGTVCLAQYLWASGDAGSAIAMLADLTSERARDQRTRLEGFREATKALRRTERVNRCQVSVESWCSVAHAQVAAGHTIAAEHSADKIVREHPAEPLAWETKARVLHEHGRHRDAVVPARTALSVAEDEPTAKALLARILSRLGSESRDEAVACAEAAIDGLAVRMDSPSAELSDLADVIQRLGGPIESARTADGFVWRHRREQEPPSEWLGAAAVRRCQEEWSLDAVAWLARLARGGWPEDLARFVTDRVEYLQHLRLEPATSVFGSCPAFEEEAALYYAASEVLQRAYGLSLRVEGARLAMLAASSLRVPADEARAALALGDEELAALEEAERDRPLAGFGAPIRGWTVHRRALEEQFGLVLLIRLRASQCAQRSLRRLQAPSADPLAAFRCLETFEREKHAWIEWGASTLGGLPHGDPVGLRPDTRQRLERLFGLAALDDDEFSRSAWRTVWHRDDA